eukprot:TRINITY_DN17251_c0_g1_i3.p1 TRINITY_DN17251_c0_g1~~TRINITY_DN17251_c0_g1_i3.p1  ORF type:complete len:118 (+),score=30.18 TRINITY_DN17251_c0_g1_i3:275-628(+)
MKKRCRETKAGATMEQRISKSKKAKKLLAICAKVPSSSESSSDDESFSHSESEDDEGTGFEVGDAVQVWWSMHTPPAWFSGVVEAIKQGKLKVSYPCLLYTSPSPRDRTRSRMPSSA